MSIKEYREQIDFIDKEMIRLIEHRMKIVYNIGQLKKNENRSIKQEDREMIILESLYAYSSLERDHIKKLYNIIFNISYEYQKN